MAQGKLKIKTKVPQNGKSKKKTKGPAVSKRGNAPIAPKKRKFEESMKLKKMVSKSVNKAAEDEIRALANNTKKDLTNAQKAVVAHHKKVGNSSKTTE